MFNFISEISDWRAFASVELTAPAAFTFDFKPAPTLETTDYLAAGFEVANVLAPPDFTGPDPWAAPTLPPPRI